MTEEEVRTVVETAHTIVTRYSRVATSAAQVASALRYEDDVWNVVEAFTAMPWAITLTLKKEASPAHQRAMVHTIMRKLNLKEGHKSKAYSTAATLEVAFKELPFSETCPLVIRGYVPPTCRVVKHTRIIPARPAEPEQTEEYESIVCDNELLGEKP